MGHTHRISLKQYIYLRFYVNYRKINAVPKYDLYPVPRMNDCTDFFWETAMLSFLDADKAYYQVEIKKIDENNAAFLSRHGLCRFEQMLIGFINAQKTL